MKLKDPVIRGNFTFLIYFDFRVKTKKNLEDAKPEFNAFKICKWVV